MKSAKHSALDVFMAQAHAQEIAGNLRGAESIYRQILATDANYPPAHHALGLLALNGGNLELAVQWVSQAVRLDSSNALYHRNLGEMCRRLGRLEQAILSGIAAIKLAPNDLDAHYNLGLAYTDARDYGKAIQRYRQALKINPLHGLSWNNLGSALEQQDDKTGAEKAYAKAVAINPQHAEAQNNLGAIYSEQGKLDEARGCFEAAIAAKPDFVEAHYNLSSLKTYKSDDPHLAMLEEVMQHQATLTTHARIRYCFALGKALDDTGHYDRAFAAYEEGNRLQHGLLPMDEVLADRLLAQIVATFDAAFFSARSSWSGASAGHRTPVFIVGMPRSGTTLLEQILCSHASVHGAGELVDLSQTINAATRTADGHLFTEAVVNLSEADVRGIGEAYLQRVWKLSPKSRFITDKMPANFFYLGLIHLALPGAKIIHAMRDPMDSCFSCYSRLFNDTMDFAYDQGTLGRYYVRYMKLIDHWHRVLPEGTILNLPYEQMVADTETQARRVLEFVGLPWDENCLKFHENKRLVKTASVAQVRKPIYRTSLARWKHFANHLRPLLEIVKDYRPQEDTNAVLATMAMPDGKAAEAHHLEGITLYKQGRFQEALLRYDMALALNPEFPSALNSKGFVLQDMDRMDEALTCFTQAVALAPEFAMGRLNLGMAQLKVGDWEQGWNNYEARWTGSAEAGRGVFQRPLCPLPQWDGMSGTETQRLLVIAEQGFGDTFQFSRYLTLAADRFAKVGYVCSAPTMRLMEWAYGNRIVLLARIPADFAAWDMQCPLMSLPRAFHTRPETVPSSTPYLHVPERAAAHWRERLELVAPNRIRIGIAWAGRQAHQYDSRRSLSFNQLLPLLEDERITWVSLQKWAPEDIRPDIPRATDWVDWTEELSDFADSAALIVNLDLVISIDSAMVHLAGALHRPVWMLNRFDSEWRWFRQREDSPWYPSVRIFNQPTFGDWDSVLRQVQRQIGELSFVGKRLERATTRPAVSMTLANSSARNGGVDVAGIVQAMQLAGQHQSAGRLREAEVILHQILKIDPRHAHALHLLGVVAYQSGDSLKALSLIEQAVAIDPNAALFYSNLAEMNRQQGRVDAAIQFGERAVALDSSMPSAHSNLGIAYFDAEDYERAQACQEKALELMPNMPQAINNLGSIERARKNLSGAIDWYRKALVVHPDHLESLSNLGAVLVEDDRADEAVPLLEQALSLAPNYPESLCNLGLARFKQDRFEEAKALLQRALQIRAGYPEAMIGLARVLHELDGLREAKALLLQVIEQRPAMVEAWKHLGTVYAELDEPDNAEAAYRRALTLDPEAGDALTGLGNLRLEQGKIDESVALLNQAVGIDPKNLGARFHLTQSKKVITGDENLAALEALLPAANTLTSDKRISLHYALGKAYDDLKEYDRAFPHFIEGARLKRAKLRYEPSADAERIRRIIEVVSPDFIRRLSGAGEPSTVPIFVLGMPRSGTTLTEQIIASHPDVYGAGELPDLMQVAQRQSVLLANPQSYPENLRGLTREGITAWGKDYVDGLRSRAVSAKQITDKMPANYLALGLIHLMLPNAKIIHVRRNPVDTCVSCFTRLFNRHQDATYDLSELGQHYAGHARLMNHWRAVLPAGSFMEVGYEDIVADMETQARRLIDFCGLAWNEACLSFHKTERNIRTASVTQVRQPIYLSSVERWRHYEKFLDPLLEALGEFAPRP